MKTYGLDTELIHAGEVHIHGAVTMPIFQSVTYLWEDAGNYDAVRYSRLNNTENHIALHTKLSQLERTEDALVTASGMAAISTLLLGILKAGDHVLMQDGLYGGTYQVARTILPRFGIEVDFIAADAPETWEALRRPNTRMIYLESISNPLMEVADLRAGVDFARSHQLVSVIDNTFASPVNFRPAELGFDLIVHSATKYLNGHSDVVAGAILGRSDLIRQLTPVLNLLGGTLDPHACFLLHRGLKTLGLRVRKQNETALQLAAFLHAHPNTLRVRYPGLPFHPQHSRASELFDGFGGMLAFEVGPSLDAAKVCHNLELGAEAPSLGGVETLVTRPATTSHSAMTPEERTRLGIHDGLIRVSVGIEDADDLIADFDRALTA
jgi:cystathionine beta-lyase/cystathionine gamma-synthase